MALQGEDTWFPGNVLGAERWVVAGCVRYTSLGVAHFSNDLELLAEAVDDGRVTDVLLDIDNALGDFFEAHLRALERIAPAVVQLELSLGEWMAHRLAPMPRCRDVKLHYDEDDECWTATVEQIRAGGSNMAPSGYLPKLGIQASNMFSRAQWDVVFSMVRVDVVYFIRG